MTLRTSIVAAVAAVCLAGSLRASVVEWEIDSAASGIHLAIPDWVLNLDGTSITTRVRNRTSSFNGNNVWNLGSTAGIQGTIRTEYREIGARDIQFLSNPLGSILALNSGNYQPNPVAFNSANTNFENPDGQFQNATQSAYAFAGRLRASVSVLHLDAAYFGLRSVEYDATSGVLDLDGDVATTQTFDVSGLTFGIRSSLLDLDMISMLIVGQIFTDQSSILFQNLGPNSSTLAQIVNLGGSHRVMTITLDVPLSLPLGREYFLDGRLTGTIVAHAHVPEPATFSLAAIALAALCTRVARRRILRR